MIVTKKALPRRTFLKGVGTTLMLPLLDAMVPPLTALADTPADPARLRRLGFVFMPMGSDITRWTPPEPQSRSAAAQISSRPSYAIKQTSRRGLAPAALRAAITWASSSGASSVHRPMISNAAPCFVSRVAASPPSQSPRHATIAATSAGSRRVRFAGDPHQNVTTSIPRAQAASAIVPTLRIPFRCPSSGGQPRSPAQRRLPSITIATWRGSRCSRAITLGSPPEEPGARPGRSRHCDPGARLRRGKSGTPLIRRPATGARTPTGGFGHGRPASVHCGH